MKKLLTLTLTLALAAVLADQASAQQFSKRKQYNSVGLSLNAMNYFGDVVPKPSIASLRFAATRPNIGLSFTRRFAPRISARAALAYGRITGDDSKAASATDPEAGFRNNRNMSFRNDIVELSAVGVFDLIENRNNYLKRPDFVPYVFAGVSLYHHNPKGLVGAGGVAAPAGSGLENGDWVALQPLGTEGQLASGGGGAYSLWQFSIPFGGGVRYKLNKSFDLGLEIGWRKTFTDYLDDVSGNYAPDAALQSEAAKYFGRGITKDRTDRYPNFDAAGNMRGKSNEKDWYIVTGLTLNYILAPSIKSPKFR